MANKFLDNAGVTELVNSIASSVASKYATKTNATTSAAGLMSASDKSKLDTVEENANNYTHPTTPGNKHIPAGGSDGQILRWASDGTAVWASSSPTIPVLSADPSSPAVGEMWITL